MSELREVFEMVTKQVEPDLDSWKQQEQRQRAAARRRKGWTYAAVAAIAVVAAVLVVRALPSDETQPAAPSEPAAQSGAGVFEGSPKTSDLTTDVALTTYTSPRYGYSIAYPAIWSMREATASLSNLGPPYDTSVATDYFSATAPDVSDPGLIVAAQPLDRGTTLEEWTSKVQVFVDPCGPPETTETVTVDGEEATLATFPACPSAGTFHLWVTIVHKGMGYHVIWIGKTGDEARDRAVFDRVLQTFTFTN